MTNPQNGKKYNYSIIVNHGDTGSFGCSRRCQYCNWQRLRDFGKSLPDITNESFENAKGYITISGGGDPLYEGNSNSVMDYIPYVLNQIVFKGHKPRIITREISKFKEVVETTGINTFLSLSFDDIVIQEIKFKPELQQFIKKLARHKLMEMTVVATPELNIRELVLRINKIAALQLDIDTDFPITIRENLRSVKYLKKDYIHEILEHIRKNLTMEADIRWLPASVCLNDNIYIVAPQKCFQYKTHLRGNEITPNYVELFNILSNNQHYLLFGSVAKYIAAYNEVLKINQLPIYLPPYHDMDIFVDEIYANTNLLGQLQRLGFTKMKRVSDHKLRVYHPLDAEFSVDVNLIKNIDIAKTIVSEGLYNINRVAIHNGKVETYKGFSYTDLLTMKAKELPHKWDYLNFARRDKSEAHVKQKLLAMKVEIKPMTIIGRILQAYYKTEARIKRALQRRNTKCLQKKQKQPKQN